MGSDEAEIRSIELSDADRQRAQALVHEICDHTEAFCDEMLRRTRSALAPKSTAFLGH